MDAQERLIRQARRLSAKVFPPDENYQDLYDPKSGRNYFYFPGIDYFERRFITPDMIAELQKGKSLLSVGCGDCHLERLLCHGFGVSDITVADIELEESAKCFKNIEFDMTKPWPEMGTFDYIIFPESLRIAVTVLCLGGNGISMRFFDEMQTAAKYVLNGIKTIPHRQLFLRVMEQDLPEAVVSHSILREAVTRLNPQGEVRVKYGINYDQEKAYAMLKLQDEFGSLRFASDNSCFFVYKGLALENRKLYK